MPNGGSDCCGTCWFNQKNEGQAGYAGVDFSPEKERPDFCTIRELSIRRPFYTYCANHPHRHPERLVVPIGPVWEDNGSISREIWNFSPDSEEIRAQLLDLLRQVEEEPRDEYPAGWPIDEIVVWQLGEFRDSRAIDNLNRILEFSTDKEVGAFKRSRRPTVWQALVALRKIDGSHPLESPPECTCEICKSDLRSLGLWKPPWWKRLFVAR